MWYLTQPAEVVLPIIMLRSGYVMPLEGQDTPPNADATCPFCKEHIGLGGREPQLRDLPWLHVCHTLLRCHSDCQEARILALITFCD
jgi:hypothetical protein